jgi:methionyl-tRNA formyltransferase
MNQLATTSRPLRIIFAGTPDFAAAHLQALIESQHSILAVYTQPDRPVGRGRKQVSGPVKQLAEQHGIPVFQPLTLKEASDQSEIAALAPDLMVVVAYGLILPQAVLDIPQLGCINVHASLLPRWRGAAPIQRAIEAGDTETGVCIMQMEAGLDTGPILLEQHCPILSTDTGSSLHDKLAILGPTALLNTLTLLAAEGIQPRHQDNQGVTYAHKLSKEEARLNFSLSAEALTRQIMAFNSFPVSWCSLPNEERLRIWLAQVVPTAITHPSTAAAPGTVLSCTMDGLHIACGEGSLLVTDIQLPNRNKMTMRDIMNGHLLPIQVGEKLT